MNSASNLSERAYELFNGGCSCSESIVRAAGEKSLTSASLDIEALVKAVMPFSGGIGGSGCLCGAVAGSQTVIGLNSEKADKAAITKVAKTFMEEFKARRKATCCRVLSSGYEFNSPERRQNCAKIVRDAAEILEKVLEKN